MGLFSSVLHLRDIERNPLIPAVDAALQDAGFMPEHLGAVPAGGPHMLPKHDTGPCYVTSPLSGHWVTLIETTFAVPNAPHLADLGRRLSSALSCYALALIVHDDDLFLYNLDYKGKALDGYNSFPPYFEDRMAEADIEGQRHSPEPFAALLPPGRTLDELRSLLNRGWWQAHDTGRLDQGGLPPDDHDEFPFEGERMTAFGTLLQLHGNAGPYPYAAWAVADGIHWSSFLAVCYRPA